MILVLSDESDNHAKTVLPLLAERGGAPVMFHLSAFPQQAWLKLTAGKGGAGGELVVPGHGPVSLDEIDAIWLRRPGRYEPSPTITNGLHQEFVYEECYEAFAGLWASLPVRWMNHPDRDHLAGHKTYQLAVAQRLGWTVPRTCITNEPGSAADFIASCDEERAVFKSLSATPETWRTTRFVRRADLEKLDQVRLAPVVFQEYVPGIDLRVTVVGERIFAAAIDVRDTRMPQDFRLVYDEGKVDRYELPAEVASRVLALVRVLDLAYAAIDLRLTEGGEHVFLESNPAGQWLFVERRTGLPISAAVAEYLAGR